MTSTLVRIGLKGQVLIRQEYRQKLGLVPGGYAETTLLPQGLLLRPVKAEKELAEVRKVRAYITKHWPKGIDCVQAVREERR